ncbi:unnamed protein product [Fraxinus pennsylvanica]|uniref:Selenoprotein O n=1 Tax=Fraxinus pennsylvanica TaxID=56036 RepID=A0AAD1ZS20_9LAMI|nr:unnamed protein product [Fraxinus pennsylvanica]
MILSRGKTMQKAENTEMSILRSTHLGYCLMDNPQLVAWSNSVAKLLGLDSKEFERPDFPLIFFGASPLVGVNPYAQCYGGHQFGMWAGQLVDGRAITLGEVLNLKSERWELQLKGAGKTTYSRFADGLAVLRSSIREFLCSKAMHSLGIPTTRALCRVTIGKYVTRDMFYDGNPKDEPGAIVCRVAQSFLRFVVDLTSTKYAAWAVGVAECTASLVAQWQGVGFTHGVLNTDNMSVLGLTIDYGPFGFLDSFDPSYTPNTTDLPGRRYCFANQPDIGLWNIAQFMTTLSAAKMINDKEANYAMESTISKADPTIQEDGLLIPLKAVLLDIGKERKDAWTSWVQSYIQELSASDSDEERKISVNSVNPKCILRNYLCQSAIDAAELGDFEEVRRLLKVMESPCNEQPGMEKYARLHRAWADRPGFLFLHFHVTSSWGLNDPVGDVKSLSRKLLSSSVTSLCVNGVKSGAMKEPVKAVEMNGLRKRPPSSSNPTQNKQWPFLKKKENRGNKSDSDSTNFAGSKP